MSHNRSFSVLFGVTSMAFLAMPIALTSYVGAHRTEIDMPVFHASHSGPDWSVNPISDRKAQAVRVFKTTQN